MRRRLSARLLILNDAGRLLLFRFVHKTGPLAGQDFWATPGGGVEDGETLDRSLLGARHSSGAHVESTRKKRCATGVARSQQRS
jgi:8-oxo-dGTP pyrophosphatase MutT (NUDIX family)